MLILPQINLQIQFNASENPFRILNDVLQGDYCIELDSFGNNFHLEDKIPKVCHEFFFGLYSKCLFFTLLEAGPSMIKPVTDLGSVTDHFQVADG